MTGRLPWPDSLNVAGTTSDQAVPATQDVRTVDRGRQQRATTARPGTETSTLTPRAGHPDGDGAGVAAVLLAVKDGHDGPRSALAAPAPHRPLVIGLDLSITSTGIAGADWAQTLETWSLPLKGATRPQRWARMRAARQQLLPFIDSAELVVQESPAYSTGDMPGSQDQAWLWWAIYGRCASREIPWVEVGTGTLKVYATGNGRASKEDVVQAVATRRPGLVFRGNDQADAVTLAAMGLDVLGHAPVVMPKTHRRALDSITWPTVTRAT